MPKGFDPDLNNPSNYDGYLPPDWEKRVDFTIRRDDHTCVNCDTKHEFDSLRVVHELPLEAGGTNRLSNLLTLCQPCCAEFTASTAENRVIETQGDAPKGSPADKRRRRRYRHRNHAHENSTDYSLFSRILIAFIAGSTMTALYLCTLTVFILYAPEVWTTLAVLVLPLGGALLGIRYPLSTVVAVSYLAMLVGTILALAPLLPDGRPSLVIFFEPIVVPLLGVAYGLAADYYEFSLLEKVPHPQILD